MTTQRPGMKLILEAGRGPCAWVQWDGAHLARGDYALESPPIRVEHQ